VERSVCDDRRRFLSERNQDRVAQFFENLWRILNERVVAEYPHIVIWIKPALGFMEEETSDRSFNNAKNPLKINIEP